MRARQVSDGGPRMRCLAQLWATSFAIRTSLAPRWPLMWLGILGMAGCSARPVLEPMAAGASVRAPVAAADGGGQSVAGRVALDAGPQIGGAGTQASGRGAEVSGGTSAAAVGGAGVEGIATVGGAPAGAGREAPPVAAGAAAPGACVPFQLPSDCTGSSTTLPSELRCTGLYGDWAKRQLACGVRQYTPAFELWSDGAHKQRYAWIPPNTRIDARDPQGFVYPVGAQFWKEFTLEGANGARVLGETRLLRKTTSGWLYTSYVWSQDGSRATATNDGVANLHGTGHTVPSHDNCKACHKGRTDFVLGWDLLLLGPGASGVTREQLAGEGLLNMAPAEALRAIIPGDAVERAALGYLHVNCGVCCHNPNQRAEASDVELWLRLEPGQLQDAASTPAAVSGINHRPSPAAQLFVSGVPAPVGPYYDFRPGDRARSLVLVRMNLRGFLQQMPPIASHRVDEAGLRIVGEWVDAMTPNRGYPAAAP